MTETVPAKPEPACRECGRPFDAPKRLDAARQALAQVGKEIREWPAQDRKRALGREWDAEKISAARSVRPPSLERVIVAVSPAVTTGTTGIIVAGRDADGDCYILADCSGAMPPAVCMHAIRVAQVKYHAGTIVGVANVAGGYLDALWQRIRFPGYDAPGSRPAFKAVTVHRDIQERLKAIRPLYEQGMVHHVKVLRELERRMASWLPGDGKPMGRVEALVVALTELASSGET